jgi:hypothetical protein
MIWLPIFQEHIQTTHDFCNDLNDWNKRVMNIIHRKTSISMDELQSLIEIAKGEPLVISTCACQPLLVMKLIRSLITALGFPFHLSLLDDLELLHKEYVDIEHQLSKLLSCELSTVATGKDFPRLILEVRDCTICKLVKSS